MGNFLDDLPEKKDIVIVHTFGQKLAPVGNYWDSYETLFSKGMIMRCLPSPNWMIQTCRNHAITSRNGGFNAKDQ